ncbi:transposase, partial [Vibrio vulnificus]
NTEAVASSKWLLFFLLGYETLFTLSAPNWLNFNSDNYPAKGGITERPTKAEHRKEPGHWEIDTVVGRGTKHCIVTLVDRMTGYTFIGQMDDRT